MFGSEFRRAALFHALVDGMFSILALSPAVVLVGCSGAASGSLPAAASVSEATAAEDQATIEKLMKGSARLEKAELKLGFIKLTDCAPLVLAKEQGFFTDEGLSVQLEAQANWKILLDRVISGELDGAHMLAGQPIGATIGIGTKAHIITACGLDLNGNGITVSNRVWEAMQAADAPLNSPTPPHPISAAALKPVVEQFRAEGRDFNFGMVFPLSTHNYELRYWLAAGGLSPGFYTRDDMRGIDKADVVLSVTPPPQMPATLEAGTIQGYCVGEPWNQQAVARGIGVSVITDGEIWKRNPEKVFGVTSRWNEQNPTTHVAVVKAIIRACQWLDAKDESGRFLNREEACRILAQPQYVGADVEIIANSMTGHYSYQASDRRELPEFNIFFDHFASYPFYSDCVWYLTQMRRWGQVADAQPDAWYHETARSVYRPDIYRLAAEQLVAEEHLRRADVPWETDGYKPATADFIDGIEYDGRHPVEYLSKFAIGLKD